MTTRPEWFKDYTTRLTLGQMRKSIAGYLVTNYQNICLEAAGAGPKSPDEVSALDQGYAAYLASLVADPSHAILRDIVRTTVDLKTNTILSSGHWSKNLVIQNGVSKGEVVVILQQETFDIAGVVHRVIDSSLGLYYIGSYFHGRITFQPDKMLEYEAVILPSDTDAVIVVSGTWRSYLLRDVPNFDGTVTILPSSQDLNISARPDVLAAPSAVTGNNTTTAVSTMMAPSASTLKEFRETYSGKLIKYFSKDSLEKRLAYSAVFRRMAPLAVQKSILRESDFDLEIQFLWDNLKELGDLQDQLPCLLTPITPATPVLPGFQSPTLHHVFSGYNQYNNIQSLPIFRGSAVTTAFVSLVLGVFGPTINAANVSLQDFTQVNIHQLCGKPETWLLAKQAIGESLRNFGNFLVFLYGKEYENAFVFVIDWLTIGGASYPYWNPWYLYQKVIMLSLFGNNGLQELYQEYGYRYLST
jgi:hypothetical protein